MVFCFFRKLTKVKRNSICFSLSKSKIVLSILGNPKTNVFFSFFSFWRVFFDVKGRNLRIIEKYSFLRSLWFFEKENFDAGAQKHSPASKYTWSAAMCPFCKNRQKKYYKSLHPWADKWWLGRSKPIFANTWWTVKGKHACSHTFFNSHHIYKYVHQRLYKFVE